MRVHDLKHTIGRRLRAAGVSFEDRLDLLGHKSGWIATHYSAAELHNLIAAANRVSDEKSRTVNISNCYGLFFLGRVNTTQIAALLPPKRTRQGARSEV